eukprot:gb/GEZN01006670.1/.p2 GENE.gb/GEZN01006670.1/~~gb/GEZN01006670.1/.p2  ORF type:complete len:115 (-),score=19.75 gb/GEZN01006670.1/:605-949(-)
MQQVITLLLTAIALKFAVNERLPAIPYLTVLDTWFLFTFAFIVAIGAESAAVLQISDLSVAEQVDRISLWVVVVIFMACLLRVFWYFLYWRRKVGVSAVHKKPLVSEEGQGFTS